MGRDWSYDREGDHDAASKERWLITYADLVTLLMVFFVVLYALAPKGVNENFEKLKASLSTSLKKTTNPKVGEKDAYTATGVKENKRLQATADSVVESIVTNDPKGNRDVKVEVDERGMIVSLIDTSFFDPGSATLKPSATQLLKGMAKSFLTQSNEIRVEGHTDNVPCHSSAFPSNWELSATRAAAVVRFLGAQGVAKSRMSAVGYADTKAISSNGTPDGRKRNRRVEIVLVRMPDAKHVNGSVGSGGDAETAKPKAAAPVVAPPKPAAAFNNPFANGGFKNPFGK